MTQFALYDPTVPEPTPVLGWFDTGAVDYPNLPPANSLLEITAEQWAGRMSGLYAVSNGLLISYTPPAAVLTPAQEASAAILAGCQVVSTGTPEVSGTYSCDAESRSDIMAEMVSLLSSGTFTNGQTTLPYADATGTMKAFTADLFKAFAPAIGGYVGALKAFAITGAGALPVQPVVIP